MLKNAIFIKFFIIKMPIKGNIRKVHELSNLFKKKMIKNTYKTVFLWLKQKPCVLNESFKTITFDCLFEIGSSMAYFCSIFHEEQLFFWSHGLKRYKNLLKMLKYCFLSKRQGLFSLLYVNFDVKFDIWHKIFDLLN